MKINVEVDLTPDEARKFLGLPDVTPANEVYVEALTKAMRGVTSFEQMQGYAKQLAPVGQAGLKFVQQFLEGGAGAALAAGLAGGRSKKPRRDDA